MKKLYSLLILLVTILVIFISFNMGKIWGIKNNNKVIYIEDEVIEEIEDEVLDEVEQPKFEEARILAVGDMMFHMPQVNGANYNGEYNFDNSFKYIKKYTDRNNINIANLETSLAGKDKGYKGYPNFNSPEEVLVAIKNSGFNVLNLSNNHILDQRKEGLISTVEKVKANGFEKIGADDLGGIKSLVKEVNGINIGFVSYTYGANGMEYSLSVEDRENYINIIDEEKIKNEIEYIKKKSDIVVMYIHWGTEYMINPSNQQVELGEKILEWGGDIILGSHPHVVQTSKYDEKKYIIYSMGNFLSNQRRENSNLPDVEDGVIVEIVVEKDILNDLTYIKEIEYTPTWLYRYFEEGRTKHEIIPINDALEKKIQVYNYNYIESRLKESYNRTMNKLNKN